MKNQDYSEETQIVGYNTPIQPTQQPEKPRRGGRWGMMALTCGVCMLAIGIGCYFGMKSDKKPATDAEEQIMQTVDAIEKGETPVNDRRNSVGNSPDIMKVLADSMAAARARIAAETAAQN